MQVSIVDFDELPVHDTTWSLNAGPDRRAYVAACCEHLGGVAAVIVRYSPDGKREPLIDMGEASGQPADNGRATQCKIHYSLILDPDGIMYAATHLSGPPLGHVVYNPWGNWGDPHVSFAGAALVVYDTKKDEMLWSDFLYPQEGCRCLALDLQRRRLYSVTYPLDHFHMYELDERRDTDYGRIGAVNPQAVWLDPHGNAYTTDDWGQVLRFDADAQRLEALDRFLPHPPFDNGWHHMVYDVVALPGEPTKVVGVAWAAWPHLWLYDMAEGDQGQMIDLGPFHPDATGHEPNCMNRTHVGGLVFGPDGLLYYSIMSEHDPQRGIISHLRRLDLSTGEHEELGPLHDPVRDEYAPYVSRAVWLSPRDLILGLVMRVPTGIAHVRFEEGELADRADPDFPELRLWG
ncbi:MAG: hypothetical protein J7M26_01695 [Armatimonadetes bacterium]|nr:hypothetical protein [Armatimonadota bacterium]